MTMVSLFEAEIRNFEDFFSVSHVVFSPVIKCFAANKLVLNPYETNVVKL